jgi:putative SOS response-associated peptidase YedK
MAPVIYHDRHQPAMKLMRWGLIPSWAKDESVGNAHINARSETLPSRNAFREAFKHRRCLIPADSFYEWQEREGKRQPFRVMLKIGEPFCFAGLWEPELFQGGGEGIHVWLMVAVVKQSGTQSR